VENAKGALTIRQRQGQVVCLRASSNAVEIINIGGRILEHMISGVPYPQGVAFSPEANKLFAPAAGESLHL